MIFYKKCILIFGVLGGMQVHGAALLAPKSKSISAAQEIQKTAALLKKMDLWRETSSKERLSLNADQVNSILITTIVLNRKKDFDVYSALPAVNVNFFMGAEGITLLMFAVGMNAEYMVKQLLAKGACVDRINADNENEVIDSTGRTVFAYTCGASDETSKGKRTNKRIIKMLLEHANSACLTDVILEAVQSGNKVFLEVAREKNISFNVQNVDGITPLQRAIEHGCTDIVRYLCENGVDCNTPWQQGRTEEEDISYLQLAVTGLEIYDNLTTFSTKKDYLAIVDFLGARVALPDLKRTMGWAQGKTTQEVSVLLQNHLKARELVASDMHNKKVVSVSVKEGSHLRFSGSGEQKEHNGSRTQAVVNTFAQLSDVVRVGRQTLYVDKTDPHTVYTYLCLAILSNSPADIDTHLHSSFLDINYRSHLNNRTVLSFAVEKNNLLLVQEMLARGATVNAVEERERSIFYYTKYRCDKAQSGGDKDLNARKEIIRLLFKNSKPDDVTSFMFEAVRLNNKDFFEAAQACGYNFDISDNTISLLDYAIGKDCDIGIMRFLVTHGARSTIFWQQTAKEMSDFLYTFKNSEDLENNEHIEVLEALCTYATRAQLAMLLSGEMPDHVRCVVNGIKQKKDMNALKKAKKKDKRGIAAAALSGDGNDTPHKRVLPSYKGEESNEGVGVCAPGQQPHSKEDELTEKENIYLEHEYRAASIKVAKELAFQEQARRIQEAYERERLSATAVLWGKQRDAQDALVVAQKRDAKRKTKKALLRWVKNKKEEEVESQRKVTELRNLDSLLGEIERRTDLNQKLFISETVTYGPDLFSVFLKHQRGENKQQHSQDMLELCDMIAALSPGYKKWGKEGRLLQIPVGAYTGYDLLLMAENGAQQL